MADMTEQQEVQSLRDRLGIEVMSLRGLIDNRRTFQRRPVAEQLLMLKSEQEMTQLYETLRQRLKLF